MVFAVTGIANFGFSYTNNSLNLALPFLREQFGVTQSDVSWLPLVYTLVSCCLLLLFGNLGDIFGYRRQFQLGFSSFAVISVLAPPLSNSIAALIFFRALQGVSYSMVVSLTQAAVNRAFDPSERGKAIGINVVFVSAGMISGRSSPSRRMPSGCRSANRPTMSGRPTPS
jgi:MFS family permease